MVRAKAVNRFLIFVSGGLFVGVLAALTHFAMEPAASSAPGQVATDQSVQAPSDDIVATEQAKDATDEEMEQARPLHATADALAMDFRDNEVLANQKYAGRGIVFRAKVDKVSQPEWPKGAPPEIEFSPSTYVPTIKAPVSIEDAQLVHAGQTVVLVCDGARQSLADVLLEGCGFNGVVEPEK